MATFVVAAAISAAAAIAAIVAVAAGALPVRPSVTAGQAMVARRHPALQPKADPAPSPARTPTRTPAQAPARHSSPAPPRPAAAEKPVQFYDSTIPAAIPAGKLIATYATGRYAVPAAAVAGRPTIWIDAWATDPAASVLDVEPGDATPAMAATWVARKLAKDPSARARLYTVLAEWQAVQQAVAGLPSWMRSRIRWWIADPTGVPHMVAGASATQWYWGPSYDISTANPGF